MIAVKILKATACLNKCAVQEPELPASKRLLLWQTAPVLLHESELEADLVHLRNERPSCIFGQRKHSPCLECVQDNGEPAAIKCICWHKKCMRRLRKCTYQTQSKFNVHIEWQNCYIISLVVIHDIKKPDNR